MYSTIGYTGTRHAHKVSGGLPALVQRLAHLPALVGCASGADLTVRQCHSNPQVFTAAGRQGYQLARRSAAMVQALSQSPAPALVVAPGQPCPASVAPSSSSGACFNGSGSGTWATTAYAAGLGVPVFVLGGPLPSHWPGYWRVVQSGLFVGLFRFYPAAVQSSLF